MGLNFTGSGLQPHIVFYRKHRFLYGEYTCVQMLHIGPFEKEWESISQMLDFARQQGFESYGRHHEIYISDPRRVPPERLKTILRMSVRRLS